MSVLAFVVALALVLLSGCSSFDDSSYDDTLTHRHPAWVGSLDERVRSVPSERTLPKIPQPVEPERYVANGRPEDLTKRIGLPPVTKPPPRARPAPTGRTGRGESGDGRFDFGTLRFLFEQGERPKTAEEEAEEVLAPLVDPGRSPLEKMYSGSIAAEPDRNLDQFGYDFFLRTKISDEAMPLARSYEVRPGDEIVVHLAGSLNGTHELVIERDGTVHIPDVGGVPVAGAKVGELERLIAHAIEFDGKRRNVRVSVSLGKVTGIPIRVVGEVRRPGLLDLTGRATVLTALAEAGGVRKSGSLRKVVVRRQGEVHAVVDLYAFLVHGETGALEFLQADDTIVVPPIGRTVGVAGFVHRPGIYETLLPKEPLTIGSAIELAGGMTPFTFTPHARVEHTAQGRGRVQLDLKLDAAGLDRPMLDGEMLLVGTVNKNSNPLVKITGEVLRPGEYEYRRGMKVSDLLGLGDGVSVNAFLGQAFLSRQVGEVGQITIVPERSVWRTARRVFVIDLEKARKHDPQHDLELMPLDHLEVVSERKAADRPQVTVIGGVRRPGIYELTAGLRVSQLVAIAGNVTADVYYDEAELIRREYDHKEKELAVRRYRFDLRKALSGVQDGDPLLASGDQLIIRKLRTSQVKVQVAGEVRFPGAYVFPRGAKITDLIAAAGGILDHAEMRAAVFSRRSVQRMQNKRFQHLVEHTRSVYESALEQMVLRGHPEEGLAARLALDQTKELLSRMNNHQATGRVVIPFLRKDFPKSEFDMTLEDGDSLTVPGRQETVAIMGHVFNPGAFVAERNVTVRSLLERSGGLTDEGDDARVYVVRADGVVQSLSQEHGTLDLRMRLLPGDVVLVPRRPLARTLGNQIADVLFLVRRAAESAFIISKLSSSSSDLQLSSVLQEGLNQDVNVLDNTLLKK